MEAFFLSVVEQYPFFAPLLFVLVRSLAIIIPPIPGAVFDVIAIPLFGWLKGFLYAEAGLMLGAVVSFFIARIFREPIAKRFVTVRSLHEWEEKISERKKFWGFLALRAISNSVFDYVSYAAGLSRMSFTRFFFATLIGSMPSLFVFYYFGGVFFENGLYYVIIIVILLSLTWPFIARTQEGKDAIARIATFFQK